MENELSIQNLSFSYGKKSILEDIQFQCHNGVTALLGNNGEGKSTLFSILSGLKRAQHGQVLLNGEDLLQAKKFPLHQIGFLPQHFEIFDNVTGYDFLSYIFSTKGLDPAKKKQYLDETIETFQLDDVIHKKFKSYSGGYKRRLGIAQAMLGNPALVLVDEPTTGLDPEQRAAFRNILFNTSRQTMTLISTHIIEDVELFSDKVLILKDKKIRYDGSVDTLIDTAKENLYELELSLEQFLAIQHRITVIEQKRVSGDIIKVKFIANDSSALMQQRATEVSLENAYLYFQKK